jgi:cell division protein FtsW (lipid II flippase)
LRAAPGKIKSVWTVIGTIIILGPPWVLVMLQPDLGTSLVLVGTLAGMLFMSGASLAGWEPWPRP